MYLYVGIRIIMADVYNILGAKHCFDVNDLLMCQAHV